jgi:2-octaprenyl-6-methoxyphenol hydroxylase
MVRMSSTATDIIIIGAGLVGTSLLNTLQGQGFRVRVLEHHLPTVMTSPQVDSRPITLSYSSYRILQTLGLWADLASQACPIQAVHVSDRGAFGRIHFQADAYDVPALGYVVPFDTLQQVLYQRAAAQPHVDFVSVQRIKSIQCENSGVMVCVETTQGEQIFQAALLIATDGTDSTARELMGVEVVAENPQEIAVTALLTFNDNHENRAYERFTDTGTLALLPLPESKKYRLVWTLTQAHANVVAQWSNSEVMTYIQQVFHNRIGDIVSLQLGQQYPLKTVKAKQIIGPGFVLLGNAAYTIYPHAAQGFNLALRDAAALGEILVDARAAVKSLGDIAVLQAYVDWRGADQQRTIKLTHCVSEIFGWQWPLINRVRGLGLLATDLLLPLKKRLALQMMGLAGRLPKLARGIPLHHE